MNAKGHWERIYHEKTANQLSWTEETEDHRTPWNVLQNFLFSSFRRACLLNWIIFQNLSGPSALLHFGQLGKGKRTDRHYKIADGNIEIMPADDQLQGDQDKPRHYDIRADKRARQDNKTGHDLYDPDDLHEDRWVDRNKILIQIVRPVRKEVSEFVEAGHYRHNDKSELECSLKLLNCRHKTKFAFKLESDLFKRLQRKVVCGRNFLSCS